MDLKSGIQKRGVGNSSTQPNKSISLASMLEKFRLHSASLKGRMEAVAPGLSLRVSLEKGGKPSLQNPTFLGTLLGEHGRVTIAGETPGERIGYLPRLKKKITKGRKK